MSGFREIEFFTEFRLSGDDLKKIDPDEASFIAISCFVATEINVCLKLYASCDHNLTDDSLADHAILHTKLHLLRTWSAKLFEFFEITKLKDRNKTSSSSVQKICEFAQNGLSRKSHDSYQLVRAIRNEVTSHTSLKAVRSNLKYIGDSTRLSMFIHKTIGNSFYPLGEELVFVSRATRQASGKGDNPMHQLEKWVDWNMVATQLLNDVLDRVFTDLILERYPDKKGVRSAYWLDPNLVGKIDVPETSIFLRPSSDKSR